MSACFRAVAEFGGRAVRVAAETDVCVCVCVQHSHYLVHKLSIRIPGNLARKLLRSEGCCGFLRHNGVKSETPSCSAVD